MPQIKDCALDINLNKDLKGILDAANFGTSWSKKDRMLAIKLKHLSKNLMDMYFKETRELTEDFPRVGHIKCFWYQLTKRENLKILEES